MEAKFAKTMLRVGTYHSPDGTVEITPERLRHWERQVQAVQRVGYAIPSHFDHSNDEELLTPIKLSELRERRSRSARNTVAHLESFRVLPDGNGAEIVLKTLDPHATNAVASNAVYVSPVIHPSWQDGAGNKYPDCLTSFDLVDWPVDYSQSTFTPLVRMGAKTCPAIRMGRSKPYFWERNMPTANVKSRAKAARKQRMKNALAAGLRRMGSDAMPEDDDEEDDSTTNEQQPTGTDTPGEQDTATPSDDSSPTDTIGVDASEAPDLMDQVLNLLGEYGVTLPDDTTDANLISHLRVALTALLASDNGGNEDAMDDGMDDGSDPNAVPQPTVPTIATMSLRMRKATERAERAEKALAAHHRKRVDASLHELCKTGRCTPIERDEMLRNLGTVRMSLNDAGEFDPTRVDHFIADRSNIPEGTFWSEKQRTEIVQKLSAVAPPSGISHGGGRTNDEINEAIIALGGKPKE